MATNGTTLTAEPRLDAVYLRPGGTAEAVESPESFVLAPLVDKIAYGIARGLVVAMKELEQHIASETRKVGDAVDRRLDTLQASFQEVSKFVTEQHATNTAVQDQLQQLAAVDAGLREADARQEAQTESLRAETREFSNAVSQRIDSSVTALQESDARQSDALAVLENETRTLARSLTQQIEAVCKEVGIQQEDMAAVKGALTAFSSRMDGFVDRLDRQADAVRSMYTAYSQRETELEQLVTGLARLRANPAPMPSNGL